MRFLSIISITLYLLFLSGCTNFEEYSPSSLKSPAKLQVYLESGNIKCPEASEDCFYNLGDFYNEAWSGLMPYLGIEYGGFINEDPLVSALFVKTGLGKEDGLPQCNLPPLPAGSGEAGGKNLDLINVNGNGLESFRDQELLYYNYQHAEEDLGITLTKFDYSSKGASNSFEYIRDYYQKRIQKSDLIPVPELEEIKFPLKGERGSVARAFVLDHAGALRTLVVEMNENAILRIRFWKNKLELSDHIEFYR